MKRRPTIQAPADTFETVRTVGLTLPDVEATTRYDGSPVLKVHGIFMAGLASHPSAEPATLVEFRLEPKGGGTLLTVTETGFDAIPKDRQFEAYRMNESGWTEQLQNIDRHVKRAA